jgi:hypothetical protein
MKIYFTALEDGDPAADCKPTWVALAPWLLKRWGYVRTQNARYLFLGFCYLCW